MTEERFENAMEHFGNAVETVVEGAATVVDKSMDFMWGFRPVRLVGRTLTFLTGAGAYGELCTHWKKRGIIRRQKLA